MGPIGCPETSTDLNHSSLRNVSLLLQSSLKSRNHQVSSGTVLLRNFEEWLSSDPASYLGTAELSVTLDLFSTKFYAPTNIYCNILTWCLSNVHKICVHVSYYTTYFNQQEWAIYVTHGNNGVSFHVLCQKHNYAL